MNPGVTCDVTTATGDDLSLRHKTVAPQAAELLALHASEFAGHSHLKAAEVFLFDHDSSDA